MKTAPPINPVTLVKQICQDAMDDSAKGKRTRFVKRLSPMTEIGRASTEGLEKVATSVLAPHFHLQPAVPRKVGLHCWGFGACPADAASSLPFDLRFAIITSSRGIA